MDRKSVIILIVCGALFIAWVQLTQRYYPPARSTTNTMAAATNVTPASTDVPVPLESVGKTPVAAPKPGTPEETIVLTNENARYTFTSHGGGLKLVELLHYPEAVSCRRKGTSGSNNVATLNDHAQQPVLALLGSEAYVGDGVFRLSKFMRPASTAGTNRIPAGEGVRAEKALTGGLTLVKEFELSTNYLVTARARLENHSTQAMALPAELWVVGTATPLNPQDDGELVGLHWHDGKTDHRTERAYFENKTFGCFPGPLKTEYRESAGRVNWATAHNQFFFIAVIPEQPATEIYARRFALPPPSHEEIVADSRTRTNQVAYQVSLQYAATNLAAGQTLERDFLIFAGPKEYRTLEKIGAALKNDLDAVMGYGGFFGFFSRALLLSMNGLNKLGLGYGLAIIAITVIIKLLFWPLTQASTRSMKRMQALQPQMKAIQEKFKDDPAKMNKKMMEFMREHKVSPLGGCLPLLLQIPVFIGFFQMVRSAIELRGASFLWACDLSKPDTIFTIPGVDFNVNPLPLLMGVTMFWQASLTPMSPGMDPAQQKIMKYFPLIFLFILYNYSAGLTLYWTVQNLLSIAQMKLTRTKDAPAAGAAAPVRPILPPKKKR
jgi:YidC/Oxa1 family membrane protein insertase